jgi:phosphatidylinositol-4,5-bisphosphate 3-kinase
MLLDIYRSILARNISPIVIYDKLFSMYKLINLWPTMSFEMCFFLLDCTLPDAHIRSYAVSQLSNLPNHLFLFYFPQIIQAALQFEHYIDTSLIRLILKRALCHRGIGQKLFWTLYNINTRNGRVMFEVYKTYCGLRISNDLQTQVTLTLKLNTINQRIRSTNVKDASSMRQELLRRLGESGKNSWRCVSPLDTGCFLGTLLIDECQVYDSFMRPFKLVWENALNPKHERFELIYKIGDDLRQDVLTLQVFRLFDSIWKKNSINNSNEDFSELQNLYMTFYDVMCTSDTTGFIRIVPNACTILNIYHKFNTTTTIKRNVVYDWLVSQNNNPQK